jgi:hypothetical protein
MSNYRNLRDLYIFKRINNYNGTVVNDVNSTIIGKLKDHLPCLCLINNGIITHIYTPKPHNKESVRKYLNNIKEMISY